MGDKTRSDVWLTILGNLLRSTDIASVKEATELAAIADKLEGAHEERFFEDGRYKFPVLDPTDEGDTELAPGASPSPSHLDPDRSELDMQPLDPGYRVKPSVVCPGCVVICHADTLKLSKMYGKPVCPSCWKLGFDTDVITIVGKWKNSGDVGRLMCLKEIRREMKVTTNEACVYMDAHWSE